MQQADGLLAVWMDPGAGIGEDEFNEWYSKEHVPERLGIRGVLSGARYDSVEGVPRYIALYELTSIDVLSSEEYLTVRRAVTPWTKRIGRNLERNLRYEYAITATLGNEPAHRPPCVVLVRYDVEGTADGTASSGHNEGLGASDLKGVTGLLRVRHYETPTGEPRFLSFFEFDDAEAVHRGEWKRLLPAGSSLDTAAINIARPIDLDET